MRLHHLAKRTHDTAKQFMRIRRKKTACCTVNRTLMLHRPLDKCYSIRLLLLHLPTAGGSRTVHHFTRKARWLVCDSSHRQYPIPTRKPPVPRACIIPMSAWFRLSVREIVMNPYNHLRPMHLANIDHSSSTLGAMWHGRSFHRTDAPLRIPRNLRCSPNSTAPIPITGEDHSSHVRLPRSQSTRIIRITEDYLWILERRRNCLRCCLPLPMNALGVARHTLPDRHPMATCGVVHITHPNRCPLDSRNRTPQITHPIDDVAWRKKRRNSPSITHVDPHPACRGARPLRTMKQIPVVAITSCRIRRGLRNAPSNMRRPIRRK